MADESLPAGDPKLRGSLQAALLVVAGVAVFLYFGGGSAPAWWIDNAWTRNYAPNDLPAVSDDFAISPAYAPGVFCVTRKLFYVRSGRGDLHICESSEAKPDQDSDHQEEYFRRPSYRVDAGTQVLVTDVAGRRRIRMLGGPVAGTVCMLSDVAGTLTPNARLPQGLKAEPAE